jgi:hypothetical protein
MVLIVEKWLSFVGRYIMEWESAPTDIWSSCRLTLTSSFSMLTSLTDVAVLFSLRQKTLEDTLNLHYLTCMRRDILEAPEYRQ